MPYSSRSVLAIPRNASSASARRPDQYKAIIKNSQARSSAGRSPACASRCDTRARCRPSASSASTVNAYNDGFVRSLGVILNSNNWVEVGWSAHIEGTTSPQVFAEWQNTSASSNHGYKNYKLVSYDTNYKFWAVDLPGGNPIFQFWFDGDTSPFAYSPTMAFGTAPPLGNSERHNWCQSLYAHMYT